MCRSAGCQFKVPHRLPLTCTHRLPTWLPAAAAAVADRQLAGHGRGRRVCALGGQRGPRVLLHRPQGQAAVQGPRGSGAEPSEHHQRPTLQPGPNHLWCAGRGASARAQQRHTWRVWRCCTSMQRCARLPFCAASPRLPPCPPAGWNLINEPRCYQCGGVLARWVGEMAAHVKALDPNHLLTVGAEGFYPASLSQVRLLAGLCMAHPGAEARVRMVARALPRAAHAARCRLARRRPPTPRAPTRGPTRRGRTLWPTTPRQASTSCRCIFGSTIGGCPGCHSIPLC